ncbi:MAG: hypothetical protein IJ914_02450 [Prevotella sp.]|nr:hypothetical protein [Prevotella sp.]
MRKFFVAFLSVFALNVAAQDDDMYVDVTAKPQPAPVYSVQRPQTVYRPAVVVEETFSPDDYCGSTRSVDEYNRRGAYRRSYQQSATDSTKVGTGSDIVMLDSMKGGSAMYRDSLQRADRHSETKDYDCYDRMRRFDGYRNYTVVVLDDPWYYRPYYNSWYSWYDPWYDPWYWSWYDPWWYGGWYSGWYGYWGPSWRVGWGSWYAGGGWYGPYRYGPYRYGGYVAHRGYYGGARMRGRDGSVAGRYRGTFHRNRMSDTYSRGSRGTYGSRSSQGRSTGSYSPSRSGNINYGNMSRGSSMGTRSSGSMGSGMSRGSMGGGMSRGGMGGGMSRGGGMGRH